MTQDFPDTSDMTIVLLFIACLANNGIKLKRLIYIRTACARFIINKSTCISLFDSCVGQISSCAYS